MIDAAIHILLLLVMPPLLLGIIGKTKAAFAGRVGAPFLQPYRDLAKLLRKDIVLSETTTFVFQAGPVIALATAIAAGLILPLGNHPAIISFDGDIILFAYLFGLGRFFTIAAALDTGSSFEGMGGAREATYSCLAEPTVFFALACFSRLTGSISLTEIFSQRFAGIWFTAGAPLILLVGALFIVLLAENSRVPFDDPNTHLELTMIHEVMVLDHSGPLFGLVLYGAAVKLFVLGAFFLHAALPVTAGGQAADWLLFSGGMCLLAVVIGVVESITARLRLVKIPQLLIASSILAGFGLLLIMR